MHTRQPGVEGDYKNSAMTVNAGARVANRLERNIWEDRGPLRGRMQRHALAILGDRAPARAQWLTTIQRK